MTVRTLVAVAATADEVRAQYGKAYRRWWSDDYHAQLKARRDRDIEEARAGKVLPL